MVKYYCDRCWAELKDGDLISNITLENHEFHNTENIPTNEMLGIRQLLCKKCTKDITDYILKPIPLKYDLFLDIWTKNDK